MTNIKIYSTDFQDLDEQNLPLSLNIDKDEGQEKLAPLYKFINQLVDAENLVVLAGSGTSLTFNKDKKIAPSMADLWESCKSLDEDRFKKVLKAVEYEKVAGTWQDGELKKDIELLLSLCDSYLQLNNLSLTRQKLIKEFLRKAKNKIIEETSFVERVPADAWHAHQNFINVLGRRSPKQKRLKIFTTNYDQAFEVAASNTGMIVIDGFEFSKPYRFNPAWYQYDVVNRAQANEKGGSYLPNIVHLYKMHGSVDWIKTVMGIVKKLDTSTVIGEPVFIYPSSSKYQHSYDSPYLDMMASFLEAVQKPKTALICLGFGFNDKHINNAITMALRTNSELMLLVATKEPFNVEGSFNINVRQQLMTAIKHGDSRITLVDCEFDTLCNLLPNRHKPSPEEALLSAFEQIMAQGDKQ